MFSSKSKFFVVVFAVLVVTSLVTVGCKSKREAAWVNTDSLPGNTFVNHSAQKKSTRHGNSTIVYLGSDSSSSSANFGPSDVSFEFKELR